MFFSDANGQIVIDNLRDGWYKVTELEPAAGFTIKQPATQEFYIKGGESKTVVFENTPTGPRTQKVLVRHIGL